MILVRNMSPFAFAMGLTSRRPPRPEMFVVVKASYAFKADGTLTRLEVRDAPVRGDAFDPAADDFAGEVLYPTDFAHHKSRAEVMLKATCHTTKGRAQRECVAGVAVGEWSKRVRVVGPRVWVEDPLGDFPSEPGTFSKMPIRWTHAFGGPDTPDNPIGRSGAAKELPNIETLDAPIKKRADKPPPAGFGPINRMWPARARKLGKDYGEKWQRTRAPFVSEDFDWSYHQSAPADQWLPGALRGDERVKLFNLHPDSSEVALQLPGMRVRVFVRREGLAIAPVPMTLDTLFIDAEDSKLALVWRGQIGVREMDLADVTSMLIAAEELGSTPLLEAHYERHLIALEQDPIGQQAIRAEIEERLKALDEHFPAPQPAPDNAVSAKLDEVFAQDLGFKQQVKMLVDQATQGAQGEALRDKLQSLIASADNDQPPVPYGKLGSAPSTGLRRRVRQMLSELGPLQALRDQDRLNDAQRERLATLEALPHDPQLKQADPEYSVPEPLSTDELGPNADLVDRDLTGRDLSGLDLSGANLNGAVLTRARLEGTDLRGASLRGALLFKANLDQAKLRGADLSRANFAKASLVRADLSSCIIGETFFQDADLSEATLEEVTGEWPCFERAKLQGAKLRRAKLVRPDFSEARLVDADLTKATLPSCLFERAVLDGADLTAATLDRCFARFGSFLGVKLNQVHAELAYFEQAKLDRADLSLAFLRRAHFTEASLAEADLYGADLRDARLYRASLVRARLDRANLFGADLVRTRLDHTSFRGASLFEAQLLDAAGENTDFSDANLERCSYTRRRPEELS